jgi:hypothetical protein
MKQNSKAKRSEAERACEWYCRIVHKCVVTCRSMVTQWNRQDLFAADCIGKRADGSGVFIQVTAGQASAVSSRRKKLEKIPYRILTLQMLVKHCGTSGFTGTSRFLMKSKTNMG